MSWNFLTKIQKGLYFLAECLSLWIAMGKQDDYSMVKRLITMVVFGVEENDYNKALI